MRFHMQCIINGYANIPYSESFPDKKERNYTYNV